MLFSSLLPGERLAPHHIIGAVLGLAGTVLLFAGNTGSFAPGQVPGLIAAFIAAFVWSTYSVLSRRLKSVPTDAVAGFCAVTALLAALVHMLGRDHGVAGDGVAMGSPSSRSASGRWARRSTPGTSA